MRTRWGATMVGSSLRSWREGHLAPYAPDTLGARWCVRRWTGDLVASDRIEGGVTRMVELSTRTSPTDVLELLDLMRELLRAQAARFHVADYSLRTLQQIDVNGPVGMPQPIAGTLVGRVFTSGELQVRDATDRGAGATDRRVEPDRRVGARVRGVARRRARSCSNRSPPSS